MKRRRIDFPVKKQSRVFLLHNLILTCWIQLFNLCLPAPSDSKVIPRYFVKYCNLFIRMHWTFTRTETIIRIRTRAEPTVSTELHSWNVKGFRQRSCLSVLPEHVRLISPGVGGISGQQSKTCRINMEIRQKEWNKQDTNTGPASNK